MSQSPESFSPPSKDLNKTPKIHTLMMPVQSRLEANGGNTDLIIPDFKAPSVKEVDFRYLHDQLGVTTAFLDVDNTLTPVGRNSMDEATINYLRDMQGDGVLKYIFLATRSGRDLSSIEEALHAKRFLPPPGIKKPQREYFMTLLQETESNPNEVVMVGDRLTHDIKGAEEAGLVTVLVDPIGEGLLKGWIPTDFLGIYQREQKALRTLREELKNHNS